MKFVADVSVSEEVVSALGKFMRQEVPQLREVYDDWPDPNQRLVLPSVSILTLAPTFNPHNERVLQDTEPVNFQSDVAWLVGSYEFPLQVDLWASNKKERNELYERLFVAINFRAAPMGLDLKLDGYFNQMCHYHILGYDLNDSEIASQRRERRARISMRADVNAIVKRREFVIEQLTVNEDNEVDLTEGELES